MRLVTGLTIEANRLFARTQFDSRSRQRLYRELAGLLRSGMSRGEAIEVLWRVASRDGKVLSDPLSIVLSDARTGVKNGLSLAYALKPWIPRGDYMLINSIEDSDMFADHLEDWCTMIDEKSEARAEAIGALAYPGFLLLLAYGLLVYLDAKILPALTGLLPADQWNGSAALFAAACRAASDFILPTVIAAAILPTGFMILLPRWSGRGREFADRLPIFSLYRAHAGTAFLQSMGVLMAGGMTAAESILKLREGSSPYVRSRLNRIRSNLLNGSDLGLSMNNASNGWPDPELALSLRIFAHTPDFPIQIMRIAKDWRRIIHERTTRTVGFLRLFSFLAVFAVISGVIIAMYEIQGQITSTIH